MFFNKPQNTLQIMNSYLNDPPPIFEMGKSGWREKHEDVLMYARSLFAMLSKDSTLSNWQRTASLKSSYYRGSEGREKWELALRSVNLCKVAIDLKCGKLSSDILKLHSFADRSQNIRKATAQSRWFDWHEQITGRRMLQHKIEKIVPIHGLGGIVAIPRWIESQKITVPAWGQRLSPQNMFFDPNEDDFEDITCFIIREVQKSYLLDQEFADILAKHYDKAEDRHFGRSTAFSGMLAPLNDESMNKMLSAVGSGHTEVLRIWVKDLSSTKVKIYKTDTPEALAAIKEADDELLTDPDQKQFMVQMGQIVSESVYEDARLPREGENHFNHRLRHEAHKKHLKEMRDAVVAQTGAPGAPEQLAQIDGYIGNLDLHMLAHESMMKDQPPDDVKSVLKFNGGWRYIKVIGDIVVQDGGSPFDYQPVPIALFNNNLDPESSIGISDLDSVMNIQRDLNALISDKIEHSFKTAYPKEFRARSLDVETCMEDGIWLIDDPMQIEMTRYMAPPPSSQEAEKMIGMLMNFMEVIGGVNSTNLGMVPQTRTSGVGISQLQNAASRPYIATEELFNDGWGRIAKIGMAQMRQFGEDLVMPVMGEEYAEESKMIIKDIDPYAMLFIERIPRDTDFMRQRSNEQIMLSQLAMQMGIPPQVLLKRLGIATDTGATGEFFGDINQTMEQDQEAQRSMQMQYEQQMQPKGAGGQK